MRLSSSFFRLPVRFDTARLQQEVSALPAQAWVTHPNEIAGNSALRLITVGGGPNDDVDGIMQATPSLQRSPYLRQVLESFGVAWSRSRLMKLAARAEVPVHADINYHWFYRVRVHIPIFTHPAVEFRCGNEAVHMAAGEAWIFDNWRRHSVINSSPHERIHLVADTSGSAAFWQFVAGGGAPREHRYDPQRDGVTPLTERTRLAPVMHPAEIDLLLLDLQAELTSSTEGAQSNSRLANYRALLDAFRRDWRLLYALFGESAEGWRDYSALRERLRAASMELADQLVMRTNGVAAHKVLEGRVLRAVLPAVAAAQSPVAASPPSTAGKPAAIARPDRPIFIVAAPRSGSTLLFETLASSRNLCSLGGEAHWLIEDIEALRPGGPGVDSNRLTAAEATAAHAELIINTLAGQLLDAEGSPLEYQPALRVLEKTPKNALRIPFFNRVFPDALFIFLWRDPRENLSSIIEAWRSGRWRTYNDLPGFEGPWSLLLPPGWRSMSGRPLEEIAAFQWATTNRIVLDDLEQLPSARWTALSYADLLADPAAQIARLCEFAGIAVDARLKQRIEHPLPHARFTQTPPDPNKWRRNAQLIERVIPGVDLVWRRLQALHTDNTTARASRPVVLG